MGPLGRKIQVHIWLYAGTSWKIHDDRNGKTVVLAQHLLSQDNQQGRLFKNSPLNDYMPNSLK